MTFNRRFLVKLSLESLSIADDHGLNENPHNPIRDDRDRAIVPEVCATSP